MDARRRWAVIAAVGLAVSVLPFAVHSGYVLGTLIFIALNAMAALGLSLVIALGAGYIGAALNCDENSEGCDVAGFPSVVEPWTWSDYDAFPEVFVIGLLGLAGAALLVVFVVRRSIARDQAGE